MAPKKPTPKGFKSPDGKTFFWDEKNKTWEVVTPDDWDSLPGRPDMFRVAPGVYVGGKKAEPVIDPNPKGAVFLGNEFIGEIGEEPKPQPVLTPEILSGLSANQVTTTSGKIAPASSMPVNMSPEEAAANVQPDEFQGAYNPVSNIDYGVTLAKRSPMVPRDEAALTPDQRNFIGQIAAGREERSQALASDGVQRYSGPEVQGAQGGPTGDYLGLGGGGGGIGEATTTSRSWQSPDITKEAYNRNTEALSGYVQQAQDASMQASEIQSGIAADMTGAIQQQQEMMQREGSRYAEIDKKYQGLEQRYAAQLAELNKNAEDPDRFVKNMPTVQKVMFALQAAFGGFTEGYTGGAIKNRAFEMLNSAIKRDISAQRSNFERRLAELKLTGSQENALRQQVEQSLNRQGQMVQAYTGMIAARGARQSAAAELKGKAAQAGIQGTQMQLGLDKAATGKSSVTKVTSPVQTGAGGGATDAMTKKERTELQGAAEMTSLLKDATKDLVKIVADSKKSGFSPLKNMNARRQFVNQQIANIIAKYGRSLSDPDRAAFEKTMQGMFSKTWIATGAGSDLQLQTFKKFTDSEARKLATSLKAYANRPGITRDPGFIGASKFAYSAGMVDPETDKYIKARWIKERQGK